MIAQFKASGLAAQGQRDLKVYLLDLRLSDDPFFSIGNKAGALRLVRRRLALQLKETAAGGMTSVA